MTDPVPGLNMFGDMMDSMVNWQKGMTRLASIRDEDVEVGATPKTLVERRDKVELYRYEPLAPQSARTPVLIAYGLIGRYTMADLQPDRSLVRSLLAKGLDLWLIDWGAPSRTERWLTIDDYVNDYIDHAVDRIRRETGQPKVTLLGICEGGVFTTCYAAQHPDKIQNLILTITPIDFHADSEDKAVHHGFLNVWTRSLEDGDVDRLVDAFGVLPGEFMSSVFSLMTPMRSLTKYNVDLLDVVGDDARLMNFLRMEKWLADRPHHPGEAAKQWLKELYQQNQLVKGEFVLSGRKVDLGEIRAPVLNIFALDDHIIPPTCSKALAAHVGTPDYTEVPLPGSHVGLFVSSKSQGTLSKAIADWLGARDMVDED